MSSTQTIPTVLDSYCHSCKSTTVTDSSQFFDTKKRHRVHGRCATCKKGKNSFIAKLNEQGERIHPVKPKVKRLADDVSGGSAFSAIPLKRKRVRKVKELKSAPVDLATEVVVDEVTPTTE
jgi:hypothetical protein